MFCITIPFKEVPNLAIGVACHVNHEGIRQAVTVTRDGEYICYGENRCKLLVVKVADDGMHFSCASHGMEDEPHVFYDHLGKVDMDFEPLSEDERQRLKNMASWKAGGLLAATQYAHENRVPVELARQMFDFADAVLALGFWPHGAREAMA